MGSSLHKLFFSRERKCMFMKEPEKDLQVPVDGGLSSLSGTAPSSLKPTMSTGWSVGLSQPFQMLIFLPLVSLPATKPCPTTPQAGTSPTGRGPTRLARGMKLTPRPGRVWDMKKLLEVRMGDARTLRNTTTSSRPSGLELCHQIFFFNFTSKKCSKPSSL